MIYVSVIPHKTLSVADAGPNSKELYLGLAPASTGYALVRDDK